MRAFAIVQGTLVAAGSFYDPTSDQFIALKQWNGSTWVPFGPFLRGTAYALAVDGATVYVTGFLFSGGFGLDLVQQGDATLAGVGLTLERGSRSSVSLSETFLRASLTLRVSGF